MKPTKKNEPTKRRSIVELLGCVEFSPENVIEAAATNSVLFVEAIEHRCEALLKRAEAKMAWERAQAECDLSLRKDARENGEKITEKHIEALVLLDPKVTEFQRHYAKTEEVDEYMKLVVEAFRMRRDCLQIVKDLVRNELSMQAAVEAGREKLAETRKRLREKFPYEE